MNKITCIAVAILMMASAASASECRLPKDCVYLDSEFSTGGGNKESYVMEVTCKMPDDQIVKYTAWELSVGGLLKMGRLAMPRKIVFSQGTGDSLNCNF